MRYARITKANGGEAAILPTAVIVMERTKDIGIVALVNHNNQPLLVRGAFEDVVKEFDAALNYTGTTLAFP